MFCSNCGAKIGDGDLACSMCGKKVASQTPVGSVDVKRVAEAARVGAKVEELGLVGIDCNTPILFLLIAPVFYVMSEIHRCRAKKALKNGDIETAKKELASAKAWFLAGVLIFLAILVVLGVLLYNFL